MPTAKKKSRQETNQKKSAGDWQKQMDKFLRDKNLWKNYVDKSDFLQKFFSTIGMRAAKNMDKGATSPRDKIFDYLMLQFDELEPYKKFIRMLQQDRTSWPILGRVLLRLAPVWINDLNLQRSSKAHCAWVLAFCGVYPYGLWMWLRDDSKDRAKTMAGVDRALIRINMILQQITAFKNKI